MNYIKGKFNYSLIPGEQTLIITAGEEGRSFESDLPEILKQYKSYISVIQFENIENNQQNLSRAIEAIDRQHIKISVRISSAKSLKDTLRDKMDYIVLENKILKRDYCPFADAYDWIDI